MKILTLMTAAALAGGCYSDTETRSVVTAPQQQMAETGQVVQVEEIVRRHHGHPVEGAVAGALLGGVIFHSGKAAVVGGGLGALASSGNSQRREYEITVQFDNGEIGRFDYRDWSPFRPGDRVVLAGDDLRPM
jgi:outer membrane lipoprotein SlyB